jgi:hypothetical protein
MPWRPTLAQRKRKRGRSEPGVASGLRSSDAPATAAPVDLAATLDPMATTRAAATTVASETPAATGAPAATATPARPRSPQPAGEGARRSAGTAPPRREPVTQAEWLARYAQRAEERNAEARAKLIPLQPGERPWPILASVVVCGLAGLINFAFWVAGAKISGKPPSTGEMVAFTLITGLCSVGMWMLWYQAVLAFMMLMGILVILFSLFLVEASNVLGVVVPLAFIVGGGFLFWKLVRVLARLQMPDRPTRRSAAR